MIPSWIFLACFLFFWVVAQIALVSLIVKSLYGQEKAEDLPSMPPPVYGYCSAQNISSRIGTPDKPNFYKKH